MLRGGGFNDVASSLKIDYVTNVYTNSSSSFYGFRIAKNVR
jgi:hypothetical protein